LAKSSGIADVSDVALGIVLILLGYNFKETGD